MMIYLAFYNIILQLRLIFKIKFNKKLKYFKKFDFKINGLKSTFCDDFKKSYNEKYWDIHGDDGRNWSVPEYYGKNQFEYTSTTVKIISKKEDNIIDLGDKQDILSYTTGILNSSNYFRQNGGYFEIRFKPIFNHDFNNVIMLKCTNSGNYIELFKTESINTFSTNIYYNKEKLKAKKYKTRAYKFNRNFFIVGCKITKDKIYIYFQNQLIKIIQKPNEMSDNLFHFILTNRVSKSFSGIDSPSKFEIDYVRAYK